VRNLNNVRYQSMA